MKSFKTVDDFISGQEKWKDELIYLRELFLNTELEETVKWGFPVYTINNKNVIGLGSFKSYFGVWFFQGALLQDKKKVLINAQEGKTVAMRQWRFDSREEVDEPSLMSYITEAIANQKAGREIKPEKKKPLLIPDHLQQAFDKDLSLKQSFEALNLTKKREYAEYIETAKQENTKVKRLEKIIPMISEGVGLNDKYRKS